MRSFPFAPWVIALGIVFASSFTVLGQPQDGARKIPPEDPTVQLLLEADLRDPSQEAAVRQLAEQAQPLLQSLSEEQRARLRQSLAKQTAASAQLTFGQFQTAVTLMEGIGEPAASIQNLVEAWLKVRPIDRLSVDEAQFCLLKSLPGDDSRRSFTATWTGRLVPPSTGDYVFSTTPINVNQALGRHETVRHSVKVSLNGQPVLDASPDKWAFEGTPVTLQARQAIPIRVDVEYQAAPGADTDAASPSALLFWAGPGFGRSIVSPQALFLPAVDENGVLADYRWEENQRPVAVSQPCRSIDFAWRGPSDIAPRNPELVAQLTNRLWQVATSPDYLGNCASGELTHVFLQDVRAATYLSSDQRRQFLQILIQQPNLLRLASRSQVLQAYRAFRFGAEEDALDMVGTWMQLQKDTAPQLSIDFFQDNRSPFWNLGECLAQLPSQQVNDFRDSYLETSNGGCSLPAAYALGYAFASLRNATSNSTRTDRADTGRSPQPASDYFKEWVEFLDNRIAGETVQGEARVNWLLARAHAEEIPRVAIRKGAAVREELFSGIGWINEARLVAEIDHTQQRLAQEVVARFAAYGMWSDAENEMQSRVMPAEAARWKSELVRLKSAADSRLSSEQRRVHESKLTEFERRRQAAADRRDDAAVQRYTARIEQLRASLSPRIE